MFVADRRLYLTEDKERVVEEGDPAAYYLFATPGTHIPVAEARRLGLTVTDEGELRAAQEEAQPADESGGGQATEDASADAADGTAQGKAVAGPPQDKSRKAPESKPLGADLQSKER